MHSYLVSNVQKYFLISIIDACALLCEFAKVGANQPVHRADHQANNDAWSLPRRTCRANYGGNRFLRFSGISKKQFSDFSWRSAVEENWRTSGQSVVFHAAATTQRNSFKYFIGFSYLQTTRIAYCHYLYRLSSYSENKKILFMLIQSRYHKL